MNAPSEQPDRPANAAELVRALAQELLERTDVGLDDDFFSAGGDSIVAMHLVGQLARRLGLRLRVSLLFANPQLGAFASEVQRRIDEAAAEEPPREAPARGPESPLAAALRAGRPGDGSAGHAP